MSALTVCPLTIELLRIVFMLVRLDKACVVWLTVDNGAWIVGCGRAGQSLQSMDCHSLKAD